MSDTIKLLEENLRRTILTQIAARFFDTSPRVMKIKTKINKQNQTKFKRFAQQRKA